MKWCSNSVVLRFYIAVILLLFFLGGLAWWYAGLFLGAVIQWNLTCPLRSLVDRDQYCHAQRNGRNGSVEKKRRFAVCEQLPMKRGRESPR